MKKVSVVLIFMLVFFTPVFSQQSAEDVAKEVLKAYKNKDAVLLKKYASGVFKMAISDSYFKDKSIQEDLKMIDAWDGKIRDVRYEEVSMPGKKIQMATVHYADAPKGDLLYVVVLSSLDKNDWVIFGNGLSSMKKAEFEKLNKSGTSAENKPEPVTSKSFSIETADGKTFNNVFKSKIEETFKTLNKDNFYIILINKEDFLQAAYSDKGYTVEYKEKGIQYTTKTLVPKAQTLQMFNDYYDGLSDWNKGFVWEKQ